MCAVAIRPIENETSIIEFHRRMLTGSCMYFRLQTVSRCAVNDGKLGLNECRYSRVSLAQWDTRHMTTSWRQVPQSIIHRNANESDVVGGRCALGPWPTYAQILVLTARPLDVRPLMERSRRIIRESAAPRLQATRFELAVDVYVVASMYVCNSEASLLPDVFPCVWISVSAFAFDAELRNIARKPLARIGKLL